MFAKGNISSSGKDGRLVGVILGEADDGFGSSDLYVGIWLAGKNKLPSQKHTHRDTEEMIFVLRGCLTLELDGEIVVLSAGEFVYKKPGSIGRVLEETPDVSALIIKTPWSPYDFVPQ
jgi:uncharacterized cupin superfamily protein